MCQGHGFDESKVSRRRCMSQLAREWVFKWVNIWVILRQWEGRSEKRHCPCRPVDVPLCLLRERWAGYLNTQQRVHWSHTSCTNTHSPVYTHALLSFLLVTDNLKDYICLYITSTQIKRYRHRFSAKANLLWNKRMKHVNMCHVLFL